MSPEKFKWKKPRGNTDIYIYIYIRAAQLIKFLIAITIMDATIT